ncbi:MAG TPA: universal stress protein [Stellaceae bacterium]|nr:universal stress protein [Stellaceae bacterium]
MHRLVLVIANRPAAVSACLCAAREAADVLAGAHVETLFIRTDPASAILPSEEVLTERREAEISRWNTERADRVREAYDAWLESCDTETQARFHWTIVESTIEREVRERGAEADLIVLAQPALSRDFYGAQILRTAVLESDRPVLVMPRQGPTTLGRSVAILWDDQRSTTKAVLNALPLLAKASHLMLLSPQHDNGEMPFAEPRLLVSHDLHADIRVVDWPSHGAGASILSYAHQLGADLLVMGAYARHPLVELLTGGLTRYMSRQSDLPILMRH